VGVVGCLTVANGWATFFFFFTLSGAPAAEWRPKLQISFPKGTPKDSVGKKRSAKPPGQLLCRFDALEAEEGKKAFKDPLRLARLDRDRTDERDTQSGSRKNE
jgi:hypothetical protein